MERGRGEGGRGEGGRGEVVGSFSHNGMAAFFLLSPPYVVVWSNLTPTLLSISHLSLFFNQPPPEYI